MCKCTTNKYFKKYVDKDNINNNKIILLSKIYLITGNPVKN